VRSKAEGQIGLSAIAPLLCQSGERPSPGGEGARRADEGGPPQVPWQGRLIEYFSKKLPYPAFLTFEKIAPHVTNGTTPFWASASPTRIKPPFRKPTMDDVSTHAGKHKKTSGFAGGLNNLKNGSMLPLHHSKALFDVMPFCGAIRPNQPVRSRALPKWLRHRERHRLRCRIRTHKQCW
jgi:hypothetical protein